jgi:hypothetical protein
MTLELNKSSCLLATCSKRTVILWTNAPHRNYCKRRGTRGRRTRCSRGWIIIVWCPSAVEEWPRFNTWNDGTILIYFNLTSVNLNCARMVRSDCSMWPVVVYYSCICNYVALAIFGHARSSWRTQFSTMLPRSGSTTRNFNFLFTFRPEVRPSIVLSVRWRIKPVVRNDDQANSWRSSFGLGYQNGKYNDLTCFVLSEAS